MAPQADWHEVGLIELPSFAGAEAWMETEAALPYSRFTLLNMHLARKWAPAYFAQWVCPPSSDSAVSLLQKSESGDPDSDQGFFHPSPSRIT